MAHDLVSIIMPAFNAAKYLEECLDSIINQSYSKWELLVVNDFSADKTFEILQLYAAKDKRIKVFQNKVKGIIPALQLAYKNTNGNYISRMDADDIMPVKKIELLHHALILKGQGHVATGKVKYFADKEMGKGFLKYEAWINKLTSQENNFSEIYKECVIPSPCWMLYKMDFDKIGAFNSSIYPEDYDLCFRMYQSKMKIAGVNEICHLWRDHSKRASRNDKNYADNNFIDIKVDNFLKIDFKNTTLFLWGAGKKGKAIAQQLIQKKIEFTWLCDNPKKIGKEIYGVILLADTEIEKFEHTQIIVAVANDEEQIAIKSQTQNNEVYFFC